MINLAMKRLLIMVLWAVGLTVTATAQAPLDVVMLGDSNTWIGGDDCDKPEGWNSWLKAALQPRSCRSYARSGATWTNTRQTRRNTQENIAVLGDDNVVWNQICRLEEAVDSGHQPLPSLIVILAGTNDAWFVKARPEALTMAAQEAFEAALTVADSTAAMMTTLALAVRYGCERLRGRFPEARIVLLTPMESVAAGAANIARAGDIIADCGQRLGLDVIRLDRESGISAAEERTKHRYTTDGTHTNKAGAQRVGNLVARRIAARPEILND